MISCHQVRHVKGISPRSHPNQLRVGFCMEPSSYYPQLDNPSYLKEYDIIMSYK